MSFCAYLILETDSLALSSLAFTKIKKVVVLPRAYSISEKSRQRSSSSRFCCATYFSDLRDKHGKKLPYSGKDESDLLRNKVSLPALKETVLRSLLSANAFPTCHEVHKKVVTLFLQTRMPVLVKKHNVEAEQKLVASKKSSSRSIAMRDTSQMCDKCLFQEFFVSDLQSQQNSIISRHPERKELFCSA
ncbi:hypothetical protein IscW_ISCW023019 [Ixodes scapularis]|uniref:Uncharacterized protein n=1 Tax=Ixodes scapularis TaxID=6945 RepID=B7QHJ3_IXOSC|nr:hypothetical protein IscW_ISCW023019 [Ixodes scapularis]|eukprot:XP_002414650.1 hypothetical protein IscW_ISCW023019 [Ixodes scapularis]